MREALAIRGDARAWALAALAEEAEFNLAIETTAMAIADRFAFKVHVNIAARHAAFSAWIEAVRATPRPGDYRAFISVCGTLIAALAPERVVSYSAMIREPGDKAAGVVLKYPNETTALAIGAATYSLAIEALTGTWPAEPLEPAVLESAAANLRRHPEAAVRFRELLRLSTPWT